jgi:hypothetical protein
MKWGSKRTRCPRVAAAHASHCAACAHRNDVCTGTAVSPELTHAMLRRDGSRARHGRETTRETAVGCLNLLPRVSRRRSRRATGTSMRCYRSVPGLCRLVRSVLFRARATCSLRLGLPPPQLHRDWARPCHICTVLCAPPTFSGELRKHSLATLPRA